MFNSAFEFKGDFLRSFKTFITEYNRDAAVKKCKFAQTFCKNIEVICCCFSENRLVGFPSDYSAVLVDRRGRSGLLDFRFRHADFIALGIMLAVTVDICSHPCRQSIDAAYTDAVKTA